MAAAARKALEDYKRAHPEVDEKDLHVDLPPTGAASGPLRALPHAHLPLVPPDFARLQAPPGAADFHAHA